MEWNQKVETLTFSLTQKGEVKSGKETKRGGGVVQIKFIEILSWLWLTVI